MKELIKEETLDIVRQMITDGQVSQEVAEKYFPELKESKNKEDERLRKTTIAFLEDLAEQGYENAVECIDWLNKQAEQNAIVVIPKFRVGDWIIGRATNNEPRQISEITDQYYKSTYGGHYGFSFEDGMHLWTIQDAKDGDVLCCESGWTCIFKALVNDETFSSYCFMDNTKWFCETGSECHTLNKEFMKVYNGEIKPATKEQRDLLFKKMHEAGYEWDAEHKQLKKIEGESAWSEEDSVMYNRLLSFAESEFGCEYDLVKWFKSLKGRVGCEANYTTTWKPSKEQMEALYTYIYNPQYFNSPDPRMELVESVYKDLKKLREG